MSWEAMFVTGRGHLVLAAGLSGAVSLGLHASLSDAALFVSGACIGGLLPDIDSESSLLGRHVHLPVGHRTITHSIWPVVLLFVFSWVTDGILAGLFTALLFGYLTHLVADALGRAGICWLWPFQRYITYDSGAYVAPGHTVKLYRNGEASEYVLIAVVLALAFGLVWLVG